MQCRATVHAGKERVRKLMKANGLHARGKRKFKATTNSNHTLPVSPDLLERNFSTPEPNRVWTGDITYGAPRPTIGGAYVWNAREKGGIYECLAPCCEGARAQAAVTCRQLAG